MNRQNPRRMTLTSLAALALLVTAVSPLVLVGAETGPDKQTQPDPVAEEPAEAAEAPSTDTTPAPAAGEQKPAETPVVSKPLKEFIPSEEIGADSAVAFPIDI